jgi:hypothetical protein
MNNRTCLPRLALILVAPLALIAQTPEYPLTESAAPAEVVQELRDRVNQFFQFHVGTINRKAIDLVAEDTKDYYFSSGKVQFLGFKLSGMDFSKDLQKASVRLETTQNWQVQELSTVVTTPVLTTWKVEEGKWVFYIDVQANMRTVIPMGTSAAPPSKPASLTNPDGTLNLPKDFAEPQRLAAQAEAILSQSGLDKDAVTFTAGKAGVEQVTFHNGFNGQVSLQLTGDPRVPGLNIALDNVDPARAEDAHLKISYQPPAGSEISAVTSEYVIRLNLIPFNQQYSVKITLLGANAK